MSSSPPASGICCSVVSHGQGAWVDHLLADMSALPAGTVARVIVTVNLPGDTWVPPVLPGMCRIDVIRNRAPLGFGANHNQAFLQCDAPLFAVVNPDIRLPADPFPALRARLDADAAFAMVAPVQLDADGRRESFARRLPTPWGVAWRRFVPAIRRRDSAEPSWLAGAFMLWRSDAFRALGGFDDRYRLYCEDVDICLRLQLCGRRFAVVETARVVHDARRASRFSPELLFVHVRSLARLWLSPVFWQFVLRRSQAHATP